MTNDRACNIAISFKIRDGQLWMLVTNRSNDFVYGWSTTNVLQFTMIQEMLASWLGVRPGPYTHVADSLHLYLKDPFGMDVAPGQRAGVFPSARVAGHQLHGFVAGRPVQPFSLYQVVWELVDAVPQVHWNEHDWAALVTRMLAVRTWELEQRAAWPQEMPPLLETIWRGLQALGRYRLGKWDAAHDSVCLMPYADFAVEATRWLLRATKFKLKQSMLDRFFDYFKFDPVRQAAATVTSE